MANNIKLKNIGPIKEADITLGDLTVLVGPQASGKSIFLQTLKLLLDGQHISWFMGQQNFKFKKNEARDFIDNYYGSGMGDMLKQRTHISARIGSLSKKGGLEDIVPKTVPKQEPVEKMFYIPAQRVLSLPGGVSQNFGNFSFRDPYVFRYFAHRIHILLQTEFNKTTTLFPSSQRFSKIVRDKIGDTIFTADTELKIEEQGFAHALVLKKKGVRGSWSYLAWSAGQREFVPMLLGLYWLCAPSGHALGQSRRDKLQWVVIEEPEMGLHPNAMETVLLLALELLRRGYKVILSTHTPVVPDLVWAISHIAANNGTDKDLRGLLDVKSHPAIGKITESALKKDYRCYYFEQGQAVKDITSLDPGDEDEAISEWGHLTSFTSRSTDVVAKVVGRNFKNL